MAMYTTKICGNCGSGEVIDSDSPMGDKAIYHRIVCLKCGYTEMQYTQKQLERLRKWAAQGKYK